MKHVLLSDVCEINPRMDSGISDDVECSFVPMEYVDDVSGTIANTSIRRVGDVKKGYTFFKNDDVIFAKITPCMENGKCAIGKNLKNGIAFGSTEYHVVRAKEEVIPEWIYHFLRQEKVRQQATGWFRGTAGQQRVPATFLEELKIPLPPLTEQKRIASLLARADRLRHLRRTAHELGESLLQSVFLEMFGDAKTNSKNWDMCIIDDAVEFSQYGTSEKSNSEKRGYPVLGMANITYEGKIDLEKLSYVELSDKEFADLKLERGDVIFNRTNSTELVGKTAYWNYDFDAVIASYLVKLKLKKDVLPEFFVGLLNTPHFKSMFQERCKKAVGQSNISPTLLKEFPMFVPPLSLQEEFAGVVARVESLRGRMSEGERQVEGLFESMLAQSFDGGR
ncbi:MAG: hypothetical protein HND47_14170 [Chloroflexi bacterium]|nr:hypothetical protein [Chloroflexota bacterium]